MSFDWKKMGPDELVRDAELEFRVNMMKRFTAANLGLVTGNDGLHGDALRTRIDRDYDGLWWMAVVEVAGNEDTDRNWTINELLDLADAQDLLENVIVPGEYGEAVRANEPQTFVTLFVQRKYIERANKSDGETALGVLSMSVTGPVTPGVPAPIGAPLEPGSKPVKVGPETVLVAVIDYGIAIGHDLFRREGPTGELDISRVAFFWDMDGVSSPDAELPSSFGRIWTQNEIKEKLKNNIQNGLLDEAGFYREIGLVDWSRSVLKPCAQRVSHGTHVTGLAAGYPAEEEQGKDRKIIAVQLPGWAVHDPTGDRLDVPLERALDFIAARLGQFQVPGTGKKPPIVINFSFGNFAGPHNGRGLIEQVIETALAQMAADFGNPQLMTLPSGNGNLARCHAEFILTDAEDTERINWQVQPDDLSPSMLQVWMPVLPAIPDGAVSLTLMAPGAAGSATVQAGAVPMQAKLTEDNEDLAIVSFRPPNDPGEPGLFEVMVVSTGHPLNVGPVAPAGAWHLSFSKPPGIEDLSMSLWVRRDERLPGFPEFGRQSYLVDPRYGRFAEPGGKELDDDPAGHSGPVRRAGTISGYACGDTPAVIAGYVRSTGRMADYSAGGPTLNDQRPTGPDASAVSDDSDVLGGVLSAGSSSGSRVALNGTSVAAPQVARKAADLMAAAPDQPLTRQDIAQLALDDDPPAPGKPRTRRTGGGRLRLPNLFGKLRWSVQ